MQLFRITTSCFVFAVCVISCPAQTEATKAESAASAQFRDDLKAADADRDGVVSKSELVGMVTRMRRLDPKQLDAVVERMLRDLDTDQSGSLSVEEIEKGARMVAAGVGNAENATRAQQVMTALAAYRKQNANAWPKTLGELVDLKLVPEPALRCRLRDGREEAWRYQPPSGPIDQNTVVIVSTGPVNGAGQYMLGFASGKIMGIDAGELDLSEHAFKMRIFPEK